GTYKDIVHGNHRGRPIEIEISVSSIPSERDIINKLIEDPIEYWKASAINTVDLRLSYKFRSKRREIILERTELKAHNETVITTAYSDDSERQSIEKLGDKEIPSSLKASISRSLRMQNFTPIPSSFFLIRDSKGSALKEFLPEREIERRIRDVSSSSRWINRSLHNSDYIGAMRIPPSRLYSFTGERRRRIGAAGENAANILMMSTTRTGSKSSKVVEKVSDWLNRSEIASGLRINPTSDSFYEIRVKHPKTHEEENLADVGLGNSQVLPVLIGGYNLPRGATFLVEEPEIHLHPKAQSELGSFFLDLYNAGVQSIIETHSEHLIIRLQQYVADRKISPSDIQIYYIYSCDEEKLTKPLNLDQDGMFTEDWPEGFFPERLEEAKKLARIRYEQSKYKEKFDTKSDD
ncbi:MAG: DUF3696 domain-containing protein, partial [Anaerolineales bacterium]|nr:DUF3696 domain-containing protein [Anaerolineales bacterium]